MIPLKDTIPSYTFPYVTVLIILITTGVFIVQLLLPGSGEEVIYAFGLTPAKYFWLGQYRPELWIDRYLPLFSAMFLHGGLLHFLGNMWYLWIFGDNVEDELGHGRFLIFYLLSGVMAGLAHAYLHPDSPIPTIGASGAIAGVMGAYFWMFPRSRVITLIPMILLFPVIEVPAIFFLGFWFFIQLMQGTIELTADPQSGGVAWWAHLGGFVAGAILALFFRKRKRVPKWI